MSFPICQHCETREATGFIRIKELVILDLCTPCSHEYKYENVPTLFGEPGDGMLFCEEEKET